MAVCVAQDLRECDTLKVTREENGSEMNNMCQSHINTKIILYYRFHINIFFINDFLLNIFDWKFLLSRILFRVLFFLTFHC